jgi:hypothetical protein
MRALSVRQPWAWAIAQSIKTVENCSWRTLRRGPLVIHANKSWRSCPGHYSELLPGLPPVKQLDSGALVGVVKVSDCVPVADVTGDPFATGPWCWTLCSAVEIQPVPFRGQVGLFHVPDVLLKPLHG